MRPELERLAIRFGSQDLRGGDVNGVERAHVDGKGSPRAIDHRAIDRRHIKHREQVGQFFALPRRLRIVEVPEQPRAIDGVERLDLDDLRLHDPGRAVERNGGTGF